MTRRGVVAAVRGALLLLLGAIAAACGGGAGTPGRPVTITIWEQMEPGEAERFDRHVRAYMAAHPNVTIEHSRLEPDDLRDRFLASAGAGGGPELVYGSSDLAGSLAGHKVIFPLDTLLPPDLLTAFHPAAFDTLDGHIWTLADQVGHHLVLVYDRDRVTAPPADFEALVAEARRQTVDADGDGTPERYGLALDTTEPLWLVPFLAGSPLLDARNRPTLATPGVVDALRFMGRLGNDPGIMPRECDYRRMDTLFREKKAAFIINGPWSWPGYLEAGVNVGLAPIPPLVAGGPPASPMSTARGFSVNVNTAPNKMETVIALLEYFTSPGVESDLPGLLLLPSRRELLDGPLVTDNPLLAASRAALGQSRRLPVVPEMRVTWDAMRPLQRAVLNGSMAPDEAAARMQQEAVAAITAMRR